MHVIGWAVILIAALYIGYMLGEMDTEIKYKKDDEE
jgi:hypothetical protein